MLLLAVIQMDVAVLLCQRPTQTTAADRMGVISKYITMKKGKQ